MRIALFVGCCIASSLIFQFSCVFCQATDGRKTREKSEESGRDG